MEDNFYSRIDNDKGLTAKRRLLVITSLLLLAVQFAGAEITEANTFIFKLKFDHAQGLGLLLVISIIFLMIRYYNYAGKYHSELTEKWKKALINDSFFCYFDPAANEPCGFLIEKRPKEFPIQAVLFEGRDWSINYLTYFPFKRTFLYSWDGPHCEEFKAVNILETFGWKIYFLVLGYELKYQLSRFFTHRENLDILTPYFLGIAAISSYFFHEQLSHLITTYLFYDEQLNCIPF
ncbi:MAG: hypothetical protein R3219_08155 [Hydrogenovibrio sp.]|nr:hypothetical protein [Hydrogenovibrio sp.]